MSAGSRAEGNFAYEVLHFTALWEIREKMKAEGMHGLVIDRQSLAGLRHDACCSASIH